MLLASVVAIRGSVRADGSSKADAPGPAESTLSRLPELHRALGLLYYVFGDYSAAVDDDGVIVNEAEFLEQLRILDEAGELLQRTDHSRVPVEGASVAALGQSLETLRDAITQRQPPAAVRVQVRRLCDDLVDTYGLRLTPSRPPRLARGAELYQQACNACHGNDGRARTLLSLSLSPPPTDFHAPRLSETLSPYRVFNVTTFGIPGTAMPSFESLSEDERWDLAFHVVFLRHESRAFEANAPLPTDDRKAVEMPSLMQLSCFTDAELGAWFVAHGVSTAAKESAVARARTLTAHR